MSRKATHSAEQLLVMPYRQLLAAIGAWSLQLQRAYEPRAGLLSEIHHDIVREHQQLRENTLDPWQTFGFDRGTKPSFEEDLEEHTSRYAQEAQRALRAALQYEFNALVHDRNGNDAALDEQKREQFIEATKMREQRDVERRKLVRALVAQWDTVPLHRDDREALSVSPFGNALARLEGAELCVAPAE